MSSARPQRPIFTEGQYIGAADLNAAVDYDRDDLRRLMLSGQAWGIVVGLNLIEQPSPSGDIELYIEPGIAWDGYGRPVVVPAPVKITPDLLAGVPSGNQKIWLRYNATPTQGIAPGYQTCGLKDPYKRVAEGYAIEAGSMTALGDRQGGITIGGAQVDDARDMLTAVNADAAAVLDGSAPHQEFPADDARWLIPIGWASWQTGAPGKFLARTDAQLRGSREFRRYIGAIAESVLAADGVIRLRDRQTAPQAGLTDDDLETQQAIVDADLTAEDGTGRLIGNELVWVEGNMRVTGNARLFGTKLELRDIHGLEAGDAALYAQRAVSANNALGGQDFRITIGSKNGGEDRFTVGPLDPNLSDGSIVEALVVRNDGKIGVNTNAPDKYNAKANTVVVSTADATGISVVSGAAKTGELLFARGITPVASRAGIVSYDHKLDQLALGAGASETLHVTADNQVLIGITDTNDYDSAASTLIVASLDGEAGITIASQKGGTGRIDFADGTGTDANPHGGFIWYDTTNAHMQFGTGTKTRAYLGNGYLTVGQVSGGAKLTLTEYSIEATNAGSASLSLQPEGGNVGIGTLSPSASLHVKDDTAQVNIDYTGSSGASVHFMADGSTRSEIGYSASSGHTYVINHGVTAMSVSDRSVGIGFAGTPDTTLHVKGNGNGNWPNDPQAHVAILENQVNGGSVLALRANSVFFSYTNFLTFFNGTTPVGNIKLDPIGLSVSFNSSGADFAECLPRAEGVAPIGPGRIVAVRGGKLSLRTDGADTLLVTTDRAAVRGNVPAVELEPLHESVALVGQVDVWVDGPVAAGDYIVASERHDGVGRAVPASRLTAADVTQIVGRAWAGSDSDRPKRVNTLIGAAGAAGAAAVLAEQSAAIAQLRNELAQLRQSLRG